MRLQVFNSGQDAFTWTGGLHPYWYVDDIEQVQIVGLQNLFCGDRYAPEFTVDSAQHLTLNKSVFERLYVASPALDLISKERTPPWG